MSKMTARDAVMEIRRRLGDAGIETAEYESYLFLEWICGISRMDYYLDQSKVIMEDQLRELFSMVDRRASHEPLQYLMGTADFMGFTFHVDERVLIPRQDTEVLVEMAVDRIQRQKNPKVLDLCCGSGCIGISVAKLCPDADVTLVDISAPALEVSRQNARDLEAHVKIIQSDLFTEVPSRYDFILSNPPYIPTKVVEGLMPEVRDHEPHLALDGEEDGLAFYRRIAGQAGEHLNKNGTIIMEIGSDQGRDLTEILTGHGFSHVTVTKDLAGLDRVVSGRWDEW